MINPSSPLTLKRWRHFVRHFDTTLLRLLENEALDGLHLTGQTLDVGGGAASQYSQYMVIEGRLHAVNIDPGMGPSLLADLNFGLPLVNDSCDNVISLNTLEHIWHELIVLNEMFRVLKPGGQLFVLVPFLYRVHASPSDYHRHTAFFWEGKLRQIGFRSDEIEITPLTFGPLAASLSLMEFHLPAIMRCVVRAGILLLPLLRHKLRDPSAAEAMNETPLGYFIHARK